MNADKNTPTFMSIEAIKLGERLRRDMGDLSGLAASMKRHGLMHPVVVKPDLTLVAGHRRIEAARLLGWKEIPVNFVDIVDLLSAERDENSERKNFTPSEAVAIGRLIEERERPKALARMNKRTSAETAEVQGDTRDVAARAVGMGRSKYDQAKTIMAAAESDPKRFGDLPTQMDATGNVKGTHRELRRRKGNGQARHPVLRKRRYPRANLLISKSVHELEGLCKGFESLDLAQLDASKAKAWADSLDKSASSLHKTARRIRNEH